MGDLDIWLAPFLGVLGRRTRRTWAPFYLRGLLGPGERKSLQPMTVRLGLSGHDQLLHVIASTAWDDAPLWTVLAQEADRLVGGPDACLVIDDTALLRTGALSVGVAHRYGGQLGKKANGQSLVSRTLAQDEVPAPIGLRLFLPDEWTDDADRCARAGVPEAARVPRAKGEIALAELDHVRAAGVRFGTVLADAAKREAFARGYGVSAEFRQGLDARELRWAVGTPRSQKVCGMGVQLVPPSRCARKLSRKRTRFGEVPSEEPRPAEDVLAERPWRRVTWRRGTKGRLAARFAATRIRVAARPEVCAGNGAVWGNNRHLPGKEAWRGGEWRSSGERKYHLSNLAPGTTLRRLAAATKARWVCEQAHQQLKGELGRGHPEGRSWTGLHRHALMACIAHASLQHLRLAGHRRTGRGQTQARHLRPPSSPSLRAVRRAVVGRLLACLVPPVQCPHCQHRFQLPPNCKMPK